MALDKPRARINKYLQLVCRSQKQTKLPTKATAAVAATVPATVAATEASTVLERSRTWPTVTWALRRDDASTPWRVCRVNNANSLSVFRGSASRLMGSTAAAVGSG